MKIKAGFYIKNYFVNYHETSATRKKKRNLKKKKKIQKLAVKRHCLLSPFYPIEVAFLKLAK